MAATKGDVRRDMPVDHKPLHIPDLHELASVVADGLQTNYKESSCTVVDCPNLAEEPYGLASRGICGQSRLADVGGVPYLIPLSQYQKQVYDLQVVGEMIGLPGCAILGAGAGSKHVVGVNCEMMPNIRITGGEHERNNLTHIAKVDTADDSHVLKSYEKDYNCCSEFCLLGNLYASEGKQGKVLKVTAKCRTGKKDLVGCMRNAVKDHYGDDKPVGLGGVFLIKKGNIKIHVMPDFSCTPLQTEDDVNNWLNFYEASAPFMCLSTCISSDPGLDLRVEHTHGYSTVNGQGGHYHTDVTPDEIEYEGYFCPAEYIYRLDAPVETHQIGRD